MTASNTLFAVLTGDIVESTTLSREGFTRVTTQLNRTLASIEQGFHAESLVFRGDSFQVKLPDATQAVAVATHLRLSLKSVASDCRISIGIGNVDNPAAPLANATGSAFIASGKGLDNMHKERLQLHTNSLTQATVLIVRCLDVLLTQATVRQAQALAVYFTDTSRQHQSVADALGTSRVNVTKLLNQSNYGLIEDMLNYCSTTLGALGDDR
ncbi:hypothetical protein LJ739_07015 [Aestuariibacter halophilus]|uniref:Transcriptional regulator n=1 Tax=Fluctibacter halophilus TaxID=226011 RepID=A0ABS8G5X6_9ALTE|nr:hypothetical protein [Aestuariibacter halophilus]MCC2615987.1 hypothetical protein [Aestuariibacter halophilus]